MLLHTINSINSNKAAIAEFAFKKFNATFVSVLNGKDTYLQRDSFNFAHLRFTTILEKKGDTYEHLEKKDYKDNYIYYTTSTTTDVKTKMNEKLEENLSDRCFNVREELLAHNPTRACNFWFLVDLGEYFSIVTLGYAKSHIIKYDNYQGRNIATVRLPAHSFYKKERRGSLFNAIGEENFNKVCSFDAKYLQKVTYSKYRSRKGFIKVEGYKNGRLSSVKYYVSTGEAKEDFENHGLKYSNEYFRLAANQGKTIKVEKEGNILEYKFSRSNNISDVSTSCEDSITSTPQELGLPLQSYTYYNTNRSIDKRKNVMVNPTNVVSVESESNSEFGIYSKNNGKNEEVFDYYKYIDLD